jgi:hypothetical protein
MTINSLPTTEQIQKFAAAWFHALDIHAPLQECCTMLADHSLLMHFPEADIRDFAAFKKWYDRVTHIFFDEHHTIRNVQVINSTDDGAELELLVRWQSGWWEPPAATSKQIDLDVKQKWVVQRCSPGKNAFGLEIVEYNLSDGFKYAPGSAILPLPPPVDPNDLAALNERIAEMEQAAGEEALAFFRAQLSHQLIFRRANGKIVGKSEPDGFLSGLNKNPLSSRRTEDIVVTQLGDRALVTLTVVGTRADDGSVHRYRNIRLFSRSANQWLLELWYNYEVTGL